LILHDDCNCQPVGSGKRPFVSGALCAKALGTASSNNVNATHQHLTRDLLPIKHPGFIMKNQKNSGATVSPAPPVERILLELEKEL
jgi:hypothetical protein